MTLADKSCRCSGIHRGMGTHISRVKSVDLDSWTDEQLQSMLKWGNTRANKYAILILHTIHWLIIVPQILGSKARPWSRSRRSVRTRPATEQPILASITDIHAVRSRTSFVPSTTQRDGLWTARFQTPRLWAARVEMRTW